MVTVKNSRYSVKNDNFIQGQRTQKMWNASRFCVSSLRRGHANLLCIVPILVYVLPKQVHLMRENLTIFDNIYKFLSYSLGGLKINCTIYYIDICNFKL